NVSSDVVPARTVIPLDQPLVVDAAYELGALLGVILAVPLVPAAYGKTPLAQRGSPILNDVAVLDDSVLGVLQDGYIRRDVTDFPGVLVVPVRGERHQDFQPVQLPSSDEGIVVPRPVVAFQESPQLKARIPEPSILLDELGGALEVSDPFDSSFGHEVDRLDEVSRRPGEAPGDV